MKVPFCSASCAFGFGSLILAVLLTGCSLPSSATWQRVRQEGLAKVMFSPKKSESVPARNAAEAEPQRVAADTTWGSAEIVGATAPESGTVPVIPTADPFPGRPGFVYSPHTNPKKLVSVKGFAAGEQVLCPYTLEPFVVPSFSQGPVAAANPPLPTFGPEKPTAPETVDLVSRDPGAAMPPVTEAPIFGTWVEGRPGFVNSPFAAKHQLVDVVGIAPGTEVRCPYSGRTFRVPGLSAAANAPADASAGAESTPGTSAPATPPKVKEPPDPAPGSAPSGPSNDKPTASTPAPEPPVARWVDGKPGLVQTPFGEPGQLVDVSDRPAGDRVICPFTGKPFLVPAK